MSSFSVTNTWSNTPALLANRGIASVQNESNTQATSRMHLLRQFLTCNIEESADGPGHIIKQGGPRLFRENKPSSFSIKVRDLERSTTSSPPISSAASRAM
jgi:hypothetical protein